MITVSVRATCDLCTNEANAEHMTIAEFKRNLRTGGWKFLADGHVVCDVHSYKATTEES